MQRNKVAALAPHVHLWQAVDRPAAGEAIARRQPGARVLVQVNVTGEPAKPGCPPADAPALVARLRGLTSTSRGLMAVGPAGDPKLARPGFRRLATLARQLGLAELSMGMSDDLEVAVQEGATMVRIGRALFGPRPGRRTCDDRLVNGRRLMASGMVRRAMVYLGLADDDYDEYEAYEEPQPVAAGRQARPGLRRPSRPSRPEEACPGSAPCPATPTRAAAASR